MAALSVVSNDQLLTVGSSEILAIDWMVRAGLELAVEVSKVQVAKTLSRKWRQLEKLPLAPAKYENAIQTRIQNFSSLRLGVS